MWDLKQAGRETRGRDIKWLNRSPPVDAKESGWFTEGKMMVLNATLCLRVRKSAYAIPNGGTPPADYQSRPVVDHSFSVTLNLGSSVEDTD
jgi:hypothetical protein